MTSKPKSGYEQVGGMRYFPRMLDKIRLHANDELHPDFHANLGLPIGADGWCCDFLRVNYDELKLRVLEGGTDEEVLQWCFQKGRALNKGDLRIWNEYVKKLGWNDFVSKRLEELKAEGGLSNRSDISTMFEYFEVDEGRKE